MVKSCMAPGCSKNDRDKTLYFHRLPLSKPNLLKNWLAKMKLKNPAISKNSRVCSSHFAPDCYKRDLQAELLGSTPKHILNKDAVPTIFNFANYNTVTDIPSSSSSTLNIAKERSQRVKRRNSFKYMQEVSTGS